MNKITDGNTLKTKVGIFIDEQEATNVESLWKGATNHESLRTTDLEPLQIEYCCYRTRQRNVGCSFIQGCGAGIRAPEFGILPGAGAQIKNQKELEPELWPLER